MNMVHSPGPIHSMSRRHLRPSHRASGIHTHQDFPARLLCARRHPNPHGFRHRSPLLVNIAASLFLSSIFGYVGIAVATSIAAWINALLPDHHCNQARTLCSRCTLQITPAAHHPFACSSWQRFSWACHMSCRTIMRSRPIRQKQSGALCQ